MKTTLSAGLIVLVSMVASTSEARTVRMPILESTLTAFMVNGKAIPGNTVGFVQINEATREVRLSVVTNVCPLNASCKVAPFVVVDATLPIVDTVRDIGGMVEYRAKADRRPVDGALETIVVRDFSNTNSGIAGNNALPTVVRYELLAVNRRTGGAIRKNGQFVGTILKYLR